MDGEFPDHTRINGARLKTPIAIFFEINTKLCIEFLQSSSSRSVAVKPSFRQFSQKHGKWARILFRRRAGLLRSADIYHGFQGIFKHLSINTAQLSAEIK